MRRREFITLLSATATSWPVTVSAQQASKTYRLAYLELASSDDAAIVKKRLEELGYIEGKNLIFDLRSAQGDPGVLSKLAADIVKLNPDVFVAGFGTATAKAAQAATSTIPVVFVGVGDPIGSGIVQTLNRPGANITGLGGQSAEIGGKRLEILNQVVPGIHTIAVLEEPGAPYTRVALPELRKAADARGQKLVICDALTADDVATSLTAAAKAGATGLVILDTPVLVALRQQIVQVTAKLRLPGISTVRPFAEAGILLSYGPDTQQMYRRAAELIDKILKGEKPADIPVEQVTKFSLIVNLKAAKALEFDIPQTLLATADEVIE